eukprot:gnl/TRDRNA2_/TRDRNA2_86835_c0_seq1.p1 gnl/TRDRNA2_/TRDRNA2_86835_c0~~gnl/TRDRNA2_/TRDRNA2_86835_c0_seq1.p1  ORF type:complete len:243 (+),score=24.27 gnl/TRDRNA2_/TRDRNA2_86835_c0_seq1:1-729(+)
MHRTFMGPHIIERWTKIPANEPSRMLRFCLSVLLVCASDCLRLFGEVQQKRACPSEPQAGPVVLTNHTNLSAKTFYEKLAAALQSPGTGSVLDLGAGAGWSTKVLHGLGYTGGVSAVDASNDAWNLCGYAANLTNVQFHHMPDTQFFAAHNGSTYEAININFGISANKAVGIALNRLKSNGGFFAPILAGTDTSGEACLTHYIKLSNGSLSQVSIECGWFWQPDVSIHAPTGANIRAGRPLQ